MNRALFTAMWYRRPEVFGMCKCRSRIAAVMAEGTERGG